jgi:hypothetical protein
MNRGHNLFEGTVKTNNEPTNFFASIFLATSRSRKYDSWPGAYYLKFKSKENCSGEFPVSNAKKDLEAFRSDLVVREV